MPLRIGDLLAVPVHNGRTGLAQVLELEPRIWIAVVRYESAEPPRTRFAAGKLKVLKDPGGLTGDVHNEIDDEGACPFEVVGNVAPLTAHRVARPQAWSWARLAAEVYFGGNSGLDLQGDDEITEIIRQQGRQIARKALDKIYRSPGKAKADPATRALPAAHHTLPARLEFLDEDSVLVFASAHSLLRRYARQPYNYDFPTALLEGVNASELGALAHAYSEVRVDIELGSAHDHPRARSCGHVNIAKGDQLLVIPYASFTRACDNHDGAADGLNDGEYARLAVRPGRYDLSVLRVRGPHFCVRLVEQAAPSKETRVEPFTEIVRV